MDLSVIDGMRFFVDDNICDRRGCLRVCLCVKDIIMADILMGCFNIYELDTVQFKWV